MPDMPKSSKPAMTLYPARMMEDSSRMAAQMPAWMKGSPENRREESAAPQAPASNGTTPEKP